MLTHTISVNRYWVKRIKRRGGYEKRHKHFARLDSNAFGLRRCSIKRDPKDKLKSKAEQQRAPAVLVQRCFLIQLRGDLRHEVFVTTTVDVRV